MTAPATLPESLLARLRAIAGDDQVVTAGETLEKLSKDFYWYSPVLKRKLDDLRAAAAVRIGGLEILKGVVAAAVAAKVPLVVRGAGTGNYGQCIPLHGGIVLDLSPMDRIHSVAGGVAHVEPGAKLGAIEEAARREGWEMRCLPSTWVKSSMGGFLSGGSGGIGSITWGGINHSDNMKSVTLLTAEAEPRLLRFEERECIKALHTYGTTGILVDIEMRLGPRVPYDQLVFVAEDFAKLFAWTDAFARRADVRKRLVTLFEAGITPAFKPLRKHLPEGHHAVFLLVDEASTAEVVASAEAAGIRHTHRIPAAEPLRPPFLTDYTWNHTTLWAIKSDPTITYLQCGFSRPMEQFNELWRRFPGEILFHLEWTRGNAKMQNYAEEVGIGSIPLIRFRDEARLNEIIRACEEIGVFVANPHTCFLEEGGRHPDIADKRTLKATVDPEGILNPGKMKTYPHNPFAA